MIVMKFGGSSLESAGAIEQAASIVKERLDRKPVLVVSAMGKTTDRLLDAVRSAARGNSYSAWQQHEALRDRKSTRLNSSHLGISYAVFCLKKKQHIIAQKLSRPRLVDTRYSGLTYCWT